MSEIILGARAFISLHNMYRSINGKLGNERYRFVMPEGASREAHEGITR